MATPNAPKIRFDGRRPFIRAINAYLSGQSDLVEAASILAAAEARHGVEFFTERPARIHDGVVDEGTIASALVPFFHETHMVLSGDDALNFDVVFGDALEDDFMTFRAWASYVALWANLETPRHTPWSYPNFYLRIHAAIVIDDYERYADAFSDAIALKCSIRD